MKAAALIAIAIGLCLIVGPPHALAQFSSGSTGADGPLNVTSNTTLNLPPNGIFNFTTITVSNGVTLTFNRNPLNTPVYMLATGDVSILGFIDVSGKSRNGGAPGIGGPGGFDGGFGGFQGVSGGDGQGPGAGNSAQQLGAAFAFPAGGGANTNVYGNTLLSPLIGGSGGSGSSEFRAGGGGGGAILVASSTKVTIDSGAAIVSRGGSAYGGGSGGAIRVVAPLIDGSGELSATGGQSIWNAVGDGSPGRTRIDSIDRFAHRNLTLGGKATRGFQMFVFPPGNQRLDIIHAAGKEIPEGTNVPVTVSLPIGSSTNQIIRVQARGFTNDIPIRVKITPENAPSATFDGVITHTGNPSVGEFTVTLPLDNVCYVHVWTR